MKFKQNTISFNKIKNNFNRLTLNYMKETDVRSFINRLEVRGECIEVDGHIFTTEC